MEQALSEAAGTIADGRNRIATVRQGVGCEFGLCVV